jgi:hypothetical protein
LNNIFSITTWYFAQRWRVHFKLQDLIQAVVWTTTRKTVSSVHGYGNNQIKSEIRGAVCQRGTSIPYLIFTPLATDSSRNPCHRYAIQYPSLFNKVTNATSYHCIRDNVQCFFGAYCRKICN